MDIQENLQKTDTIITNVYWIRKPDYTDINTEGYVGVSKNIKKRWQQLKANAKRKRHPNSLLESAINEYQDELVYEVVFTGTESECYELEKKLRPSPSIGWNLRSGGPIGKITKKGRERLRASSSHLWPLSQKWRAYQTRTGVKITLAEYEKLVVKQKIKDRNTLEEALLHYKLLRKYKDYKVLNVLTAEELDFKDFAASMNYDALIGAITNKESTWELLAP